MIIYEAVDDAPEPSRPEPEGPVPEPVADNLQPNYNVTPTSPVPVIRTRTRDARRVVSVARWGLLPHWAPDERAGARFINARAETVATLPAFRSAFARRRCLVPADGWFEWRRDPDGAGRQVLFMTPQDGAGVSFAGLWEVWPGPHGRRLTCSILTTEAVGDLRDVHDRMPLLLPPSRYAAWLDPSTDDPAEMLRPPAEDLVGALEIRRVGAAVGNVRAVGPELVAPYAAPVAAAQTLF